MARDDVGGNEKRCSTCARYTQTGALSGRCSRLAVLPAHGAAIGSDNYILDSPASFELLDGVRAGRRGQPRYHYVIVPWHFMCTYWTAALRPPEPPEPAKVWAQEVGISIQMGDQEFFVGQQRWQARRDLEKKIAGENGIVWVEPTGEDEEEEET